MQTKICYLFTKNKNGKNSRVHTKDFFGKAVLFKSQAWRDATPFLVLFNFLHLINHQNRVNLLLQLNCR